MKQKIVVTCSNLENKNSFRSEVCGHYQTEISEPHKLISDSNKAKESSSHNSVIEKTDYQTKVFYLISLLISYLTITGGVFSFEAWMLVGVPIWALWLTVPVFFSEDEDFRNIIVSYIIWLLLQSVIYYYGLVPPAGSSPLFM